VYIRIIKKLIKELDTLNSEQQFEIKRFIIRYGKDARMRGLRQQAFALLKATKNTKLFSSKEYIQWWFFLLFYRRGIYRVSNFLAKNIYKNQELLELPKTTHLK